MGDVIHPTFASDMHAAAPSVDANLFTALRAGFAADPGRVAVETDGGGMSPPLRYAWRDLDHASARIANLLASLDLPPCSRIAAQVDKSPEALMLYLAVLRSGHVFVPLNTAYQQAEIGYFVGDAEPAVVVCAPRDIGWIGRIAFTAGAKAVYTLDDRRGGSLLERAAHFPDEHAIEPRRTGDLASIIYTSGTTGRSKGAMLSHGNLASNARTLHVHWGWRDGDVLIHALPIFHVHGLFVAIHGALLNGSRMIWMNRFDAARVVARLPDASVFMGVPTMYVRMLAEPALTRSACDGMRLFVSGSAPLRVETFDAWIERTGHTILERYGMSETVMLTSNPFDAALGDRRRGTVGRALPDVDVRIADDQDRPVPINEIGGIQVRGPSVFSGYWRMPEKTTDEFTADGWFRTGDVGRVENDGYLTIVGRSKDVVITGGFNVYPAEIESQLNDLPEVEESAVFGVPDEDLGEAVAAVIVPKNGVGVDAEQILQTLKTRIARFKVPRTLSVVAEIPRNAMGKVQKNVLRERHR